VNPARAEHNQQRHPGAPEFGQSLYRLQTQNGFGAFGQPDIAATLVAVAGKAIRESGTRNGGCTCATGRESGGAIVYLDGTTATITNL
jgi:hypothetical protein